MKAGPINFMEKDNFHYRCEDVMFNEDDETLVVFEIMDGRDYKMRQMIRGGAVMLMTLILTAGACFGLSFLGLPLPELLLIALPLAVILVILIRSIMEKRRDVHSLRRMYGPLTDGFRRRFVYEVLPESELYVHDGTMYAFKLNEWHIDGEPQSIVIERDLDDLRHIVHQAAKKRPTFTSFAAMDRHEEARKKVLEAIKRDLERK